MNAGGLSSGGSMTASTQTQSSEEKKQSQNLQDLKRYVQQKEEKKQQELNKPKHVSDVYTWSDDEEEIESNTADAGDGP